MAQEFVHSLFEGDALPACRFQLLGFRAECLSKALNPKPYQEADITNLGAKRALVIPSLPSTMILV